MTFATKNSDSHPAAEPNAASPPSAADPESSASESSVDKSGERVQRMFSEIAPNYDRMNHVLSMNVDRYWRWRTVNLLGPYSDAPILDTCTGTGDLALAFHRKTRGRVAIQATDFCEQMLDVGRVKARKLKSETSIEFRQADTQQLPFEADRFQIVSAAFGLRNVADTDAGLREMTRVCQPGGKVAVLEFSTPRRQPMKSFYLWYFKNILPRIGQAFARNSSAAYEYLPQSVGEFPAYEALAERMRLAGLRDVQFHPLTFGIATLYTGVK